MRLVLTRRLAHAATCAGNAGAYAIVNTSPLLLPALQRGLGLDEAEAGGLMTTALLAMGVMALGLSPLLVGRRKKYVALAAAFVLAMGFGFAAVAESRTLMLLSMVAIGLGAGALLAGVNAIIAATEAPDRLFGYALMSAYAVAAALALVLAPAIASAGHRGGFGVLAVFAVGLWPLLLALPASEGNAPAGPVAGARNSSGGGIALLVGIGVIGVPMMGFFTFVGGLGESQQMDPSRIAQIFAAQQVASVVGAWLAARYCLRLGLRRGILAATLVHSAVIALAVWGPGEWPFAVGVVGEGLSFLFLLPPLLTLAAQLDPSGRWAAAANGALFLATGLAPAVAGSLVVAFGYDAIGWLMLVATPVGLMAFGRSLRAVPCGLR